ncbi:helix-turn-helix domain-containing protein [Morganella psychrotolerans]|uniref:helix-turn-helix domain-containing protein n=1 Tax=Morganella psychrotolerans TaxID=368603 RepID=UPI0039AFA941
MTSSDEIKDNISVIIRKRIFDKRKERHLSGREVATLLGVSQQQYSCYERGISRIDIVTLVNISIILRTNIDWFLKDIMSLCGYEDILKS